MDDVVDGRAEFAWLKRTGHYLIAGGLLVWVIPRHILRLKGVAEYLDVHFDDVQVNRFGDGAYERFKQIVVFGKRRNFKQLANHERCETLRQMAFEEATIEPLDGDALSFVLPRLPKKRKFHFGRNVITREMMFEDAEDHGVKTDATFLDHYAPTQEQRHLNPLVPLRVGHLNGVIAAGHLNNEFLDDGKDVLLIKGQSYKDMVARTQQQGLPDDAGIKVTQTWTDQVITRITTISPEGEIEAVEKDALEPFFERWLPHLTEKVQQKFAPRYQFDMNGYGDVLGGLNQKRLIPLVGKPGLLPVQAHAAAALATQFETHKEAFLIGEMGTGVR